MFAEELIEAYPEAKVVLVERDVERWFKSFDDAVLSSLFGPMADFAVGWLEPLLGSRSGIASRKMVLGYFEAEDVEGVRKNAREKYTKHYERVRSLVPKERLLVFELAQGWEPLCRFLRRDLPDVEFPRVNETEALKKKVEDVQKAMGRAILRKFGPFVLAAVAGGGAYLWMR